MARERGTAHETLLKRLVAGCFLAASSSCGLAATEEAASGAAVVADPLYETMLALDTALFDSFNKCSDPAQLAKHAVFFDKDVEFYHDLGGLTPGGGCTHGQHAQERL
jgi:hypothetical protein